MKSVAKWVLIVWSVLSLIGICWGMLAVAQSFTTPQNDYESAGQFAGIGCGLGIWLIIWLAIAGPAALVYFVSGKREATRVEIVQQPSQYVAIAPQDPVVGIRPDEKKCPYCAETIKRDAKVCRFCGRDLTGPIPPTASAIATPSSNSQLSQTKNLINRLCPKCGIPMQIKVANQGKYQGRSFYVCPNYQQCRQAFPIEEL